MKIVKGARTQQIIEHFNLFFEPGTYTNDHLQFDKIIFYDVARMVDFPVIDIKELKVFYDKEYESMFVVPCCIALKNGDTIYLDCMKIEGIIYQQQILDNEKLEVIFKKHSPQCGLVFFAIF